MKEMQTAIYVHLGHYRFGISAKLRFSLWNVEFRNKRVRMVGNEGHCILLEWI